MAASRRLTALPADPDPAGTGLAARIDQEIGALDEFADRDGVHTAALAFDPQQWQLMRFVLWDRAVPQDADATERYQVLHLSAPGLADLPRGRHF